MKINAIKSENIEIEVNPTEVLRSILKLTLPVFNSDVMIQDGWVFEYERVHWNDYDWSRKRPATQEEIFVYEAYLLLLEKVKNK